MSHRHAVPTANRTARLRPCRAVRGVLARGVLALAVAACAYRPGAENPVARSLTWFSYAEAADLRAACGPGTPDRLRLIYNGHYDEQVRSYDVNAIDDGAFIEVRVRGAAGDVGRGIALADPFGPWRGEGKLVRITAPEFNALRKSLMDSGLMRPAPARLRLDSAEFYWLASACLDGRFVVNAWKYPSQRFTALGFPAVLLRHDPTGIELNPPRPANAYPDRKYERFTDDDFQFLLDGNRLVTGGAPFGG